MRSACPGSPLPAAGTGASWRCGRLLATAPVGVAVFYSRRRQLALRSSTGGGTSWRRGLLLAPAPVGVAVVYWRRRQLASRSSTGAGASWSRGLLLAPAPVGCYPPAQQTGVQGGGALVGEEVQRVWRVVPGEWCGEWCQAGAGAMDFVKPMISAVVIGLSAFRRAAARHRSEVPPRGTAARHCREALPRGTGHFGERAGFRCTWYHSPGWRPMAVGSDRRLGVLPGGAVLEGSREGQASVASAAARLGAAERGYAPCRKKRMRRHFSLDS